MQKNTKTQINHHIGLCFFAPKNIMLKSVEKNPILWYNKKSKKAQCFLQNRQHVKGALMIAIFFGNSTLGLVVGLIFSLLFVSFDSGWKKTLSVIFASGTSGVGLWTIYDKYGINDYTKAFTALGAFCISFLIAFISFMLIMCKLIKDRDDKDIIRIRDIILGQKKYIEKYYEKREKEIDEKLNIPALEKRERDVLLREQHCSAQFEILERDKEDFSKVTERKLRISLPEKKNLVVTKEFLELFPSYVENLSSFIKGIRSETELFLGDHELITREDFRIFLVLLSIQTIEHLFGKGARDVRVHFRYYDEDQKGYKKLVSVIGGKESSRDLTFIPYDKANMIIKSFECKRALIKSHNIEYDFVGNNSTTWTEYITGTFYNITRCGKPCLSFGISVKSAVKVKHLFNFLNYCKFEAYLQEEIEKINDRCPIETILYGDHNI